MTNTPWLAPESPDLVWFSGSDTERFLNDLISQDIAGMSAGEVRRSLLLGPEGKLDHILWVIRADQRLGLVTDGGRGGSLAATLGRYRIRVDVEIEQEPGPVWLVVGDWEGFRVDWRDVPRALIVGERPDIPRGTAEEYERLRIASGEPRFGVDVDTATIPQESGLVPVTVDFGKGCYLGQELVARINSRGGNVPRRLRIVEFEGPVAPPGAVVVLDDEERGVLTSVADPLGMGLLKRTVAVGDLVEIAGSWATVREIPTSPRA